MQNDASRCSITLGNQAAWLNMNEGVDERGFTLSLNNVVASCGLSEEDSRLGTGYLFERFVQHANPHMFDMFGRLREGQSLENKKIRKIQFVETLSEVKSILCDEQPEHLLKKDLLPPDHGSEKFQAASRLVMVLNDLGGKKAWKACARCAPSEELVGVKEKEEKRPSMSLSMMSKAKGMFSRRKKPQLSAEQIQKNLNDLWASLGVNFDSSDEEDAGHKGNADDAATGNADEAATVDAEGESQQAMTADAISESQEENALGESQQAMTTDAIIESQWQTPSKSNALSNMLKSRNCFIKALPKNSTLAGSLLKIALRGDIGRSGNEGPAAIGKGSRVGYNGPNDIRQRLEIAGDAIGSVTEVSGDTAMVLWDGKESRSQVKTFHLTLAPGAIGKGSRVVYNGPNDIRQRLEIAGDAIGSVTEVSGDTAMVLWDGKESGSQVKTFHLTLAPGFKVPARQMSDHTRQMYDQCLTIVKFSSSLRDAGDSTWTKKLSDSLRPLAKNNLKLDMALRPFGWDGSMFSAPPNLEELLAALSASTMNSTEDIQRRRDVQEERLREMERKKKAWQDRREQKRREEDRRANGENQNDNSLEESESTTTKGMFKDLRSSRQPGGILHLPMDQWKKSAILEPVSSEAEIAKARRCQDFLAQYLGPMSKDEVQETLVGLGLEELHKEAVRHAAQTNEPVLSAQLIPSSDLDGPKLFQYLFPEASSLPRHGVKKAVRILYDFARSRQRAEGTGSMPASRDSTRSMQSCSSKVAAASRKQGSARSQPWLGSLRFVSFHINSQHYDFTIPDQKTEAAYSVIPKDKSLSPREGNLRGAPKSIQMKDNVKLRMQAKSQQLSISGYKQSLSNSASQQSLKQPETLGSVQSQPQSCTEEEVPTESSCSPEKKKRTLTAGLHPMLDDSKYDPHVRTVDEKKISGNSVFLSPWSLGVGSLCSPHASSPAQKRRVGTGYTTQRSANKSSKKAQSQRLADDRHGTADVADIDQRRNQSMKFGVDFEDLPINLRVTGQ